MTNEIIDLSKRSINTSVLNTKPMFISDTSSHTNVRGFAIYGVTDTVFDAATIFENWTGTNPNTITLPAGQIWYVKSSLIKLTSGTCIVYRK